MKGKILDYSIQNSTGVISGDNGTRYNFTSAEWKSDKSPTVNQIVDFNTDNDNATGIYIDKNVSSGSKSKIAAGLLAFFLGGFGIHKFYLGCTGAGITMLVIFFIGIFILGIPSFIIAVVAFIEAILYFIKSDEDFEEIYVSNKKCWF